MCQQKGVKNLERPGRRCPRFRKRPSTLASTKSTRARNVKRRVADWERRVVRVGRRKGSRSPRPGLKMLHQLKSLSTRAGRKVVCETEQLRTPPRTCWLSNRGIFLLTRLHSTGVLRMVPLMTRSTRQNYWLYHLWYSFLTASTATVAHGLSSSKVLMIAKLENCTCLGPFDIW